MTMVKATQIALFDATAVSMAVAGQARADDKAPTEKEKCYGVARIGNNDRQTPVSSCAGTNKVDGNGQAFILLPKGTCDKIAGGSTSPKG